MSGQEGDTRRFRKAKKDDYYATQSAFETTNQHTSRSPDEWPRCGVCKQEIKGVTFGSPPSNVACLRCNNER